MPLPRLSGRYEHRSVPPRYTVGRTYSVFGPTSVRLMRASMAAYKTLGGSFTGDLPSIQSITMESLLGPMVPQDPKCMNEIKLDVYRSNWDISLQVLHGSFCMGSPEVLRCARRMNTQCLRWIPSRICGRRFARRCGMRMDLRGSRGLWGAGR